MQTVIKTTENVLEINCMMMGWRKSSKLKSFSLLHRFTFVCGLYSARTQGSAPPNSSFVTKQKANTADKIKNRYIPLVNIKK